MLLATSEKKQNYLIEIVKHFVKLYNNQMETSSENGSVVAAHTGVRRNPSIKKLLKLPMWGSGK